MAFTTNRFCWHGLLTTDPTKSEAFYTEVLGWKLETMDMGGASATLFVAEGQPFGHVGPPPSPNFPCQWENYLRVDDVDTSTTKAVGSGGTQIQGPTDIPPGRFSVVASPSGAPLWLFHESDETESEHHPGGTTGVQWTELHSTAINDDVKWLQDTFGFETSMMPIPGGGTYYMLKDGNEMRAGASVSFLGDAPATWLTWFGTTNCDDAVARVKRLGGTILSEPSNFPGVGRMSMIRDNIGVPFGLLQPE